MPDYIKAGLAALAVALLSGPVLIPILRRFKFGQFVRNDGPKTHLTKSGTPTMGGVMFFITMPVAMLFADKLNWQSFVALALMLALGLVGFADDYLKIKKRQSEGLTAPQKFAAQAVIGLAFGFLVWFIRGGGLWIPFINQYLDLGPLYILFAAVLIAAAANAVNFTDGLDGLCAGVTFFVALAYLLICRAWSLGHLTWFGGAMAGSCVGFLFFNLHPARVFMGDTGSLALGGAVAAMAILTETELLLPLLGIIYVVEVLSVILQVAYFKKTRGKRLFRMAPIHHHFELCGWNESQVDAAFWLVTALAALAFLAILL